jgi:predicted acylesterase/phospholipase RssA
MVGLAVSGGGSRAALFAAGSFEALGRLGVGSHQPSVLERVSYISNVSGGSLASAYFAIKKPQRNVAMLNEAGLMNETYERFFEQFKTSMAKDYEWPLLWRQLLSVRWFNPSWSARSLVETLSDDYFGSSNFADRIGNSLTRIDLVIFDSWHT